MNEVFIEVKGQILQRRFKNKDIITLEELISDYEDLIFDVERLEEELEDIRNTTEEDEYNSYMDDLRNRERDLNEQ